MTNLEFACLQLRREGFYDVAQILEARTDKEWERCKMQLLSMQSEHDGRIGVRTIINTGQDWSRTREGAMYWNYIYASLAGLD